jgi:hypothetical protein
MIPQNELNTFRAYLRDTPARAQSTQGWTNYLRANAGPAGAYDAKPGRRLLSFEEMYRTRIDGHGRILALDQMERRGGNVIAPNGQPCPEVLEDSDPSPQREVETTDAEPKDHEGYPSGRAPPWGPHDEPRHQRVQEPHMATDPPTSEAQAKAMYAAREGRSTLGIPKSVGEHFVGKSKDAALETVTHGQQGAEHGPEDWERTRGRDQEHEDRDEDEALIAKVLERLGYSSLHVQKAIADRARKARDQGPPSFPGRPSAFEGSEHGKLAGDSASFVRMYGSDVTRLTSHGSGAVAFTPKVFVHRSRG